nr:phage antirepressor KilAC domain-containing protein [Variovorax sp. IB41]
MTSREIADLVESRHDNVRVTIERLAEKGLVSFTATQEPTPGGGKATSVYLVNKRDSYVIVAQLSPQFTARLVDRWQELEQQVVAPISLDDPVALRAALLGYTEKVLALETTVKAQAPKVEFADALLNADGTTLVRDVAKTIGVGVRPLERALREKGVILANNAPAAQYVSKGYFKEETHPFETKTRGTQISHTARVTGKGIEFIRRFVRRHAGLLGRQAGAA